MKILAADDELMQLNQLENSIAEAIPKAEIVSFSQPSKFMEWIENDGQADIAFLDIEMGSMTGIQIAEKLLEVKPQLNIIFVTGHTHYAADAF
ncbi:MAG: response regulator [Clostridia bacterium]|nr:response regulator [Clostridia bacterium]